MLTTDNCVQSIVEAFHRSLDILRKVRRHRRSPSKASPAAGKAGTKMQLSSDELQLSNSLRRNPADVQQEYERHRAVNGERFALGDAIAQTSLAQTLLKLNTGLVNIISSLLSSGRDDRRLDYRALASLSDVSRREAVDALSQLSLRLSQSAVTLMQPSLQRVCPRCRNASCVGLCNSSQPLKQSAVQKSRVESRRAGSRSSQEVKKKNSSPQIRRVHLSSASEPQLAMVKSRPRGRRTASSSTNQLPPTKGLDVRSDKKHARHDSAQAHIEPRSSPTQNKYTMPLAIPHDASSTINSPVPLGPLAAQSTPGLSLPAQVSHQFTTSSPVDLPTTSPVPRRRLEKATPSTHTFLSASTKLGEIPMHRWNKPFDYAEMERMNADYYAGITQSNQAVSKPPKRGLFGRMFGRGKGKAGSDGPVVAA